MTTTSAAQTATKLFVEQYRARTARSLETFEQARSYLAGGVPGNASYRLPYPLYVREASGARLIDVDGNEYIDLLMGGGPHPLGHAPAPVMEAVKRQLDHGTSTIAPGEATVELARRIQGHAPHMERLRFVHTGSEAVHISLRVARAFTGRQRVGKFEGNFHGGYDNELISGTRFAGPPEAPEAVPEGGGIPDSVLGHPGAAVQRRRGHGRPDRAPRRRAGGGGRRAGRRDLDGRGRGRDPVPGSAP